jgi:hypothetical protein
LLVKFLCLDYVICPNVPLSFAQGFINVKGHGKINSFNSVD